MQSKYQISGFIMENRNNDHCCNSFGQLGISLNLQVCTTHIILYRKWEFKEKKTDQPYFPKACDAN